ncbi:MAG: hypothetical protein IH994_04065 [Proteobacteria bacterium]|nr:hypothetical protein [Pseudomonadota bacterium]
MVADGDVVVVYCRLVDPPHDKIAVCFSSEHNLYFFINSQARRPPEAQVFVRENELDCLSHDSYIDTGFPITFDDTEMTSLRNRGQVSDEIKAQVKVAVKDHGLLIEYHRKMVETNL